MAKPPCPKCSRNWSQDRDGDHCLLHGEYSAPVVQVELPTRGDAWTPNEERFVSEHLQDMTFQAIADALPGRTRKAVEHLVYQRGWNKRYVRLRPEQLLPLPRGLAPADRAVAVLIRERAANGWAVSNNQMAVATGMVRQQVQRSVRRLFRLGLIEVVRHRDDWHGHRPNSYRWVATDSDARVRGSNEEVQ